jgi:hypothetical protein
MVATGFGFQIRSGDAREKRTGKTNLAILLYQPCSHIFVGEATSPTNINHYIRR